MAKNYRIQELGENGIYDEFPGKYPKLCMAIEVAKCCQNLTQIIEIERGVGSIVWKSEENLED